MSDFFGLRSMSNIPQPSLQDVFFGSKNFLPDPSGKNPASQLGG
jgi:hypothetical protein